VVCLSVCQSVTVVRPAETVELIEMLFGLCSRMGPRNHIRWVPDPPWEGTIVKFEDKVWPIVKYRDSVL